MPRLSHRLLGYLVVATGFLGLAYGLTMLSVLDYFSLEAPPRPRWRPSSTRTAPSSRHP